MVGEDLHEKMEKWGPFRRELYDNVVLSMGNPYEAHSPAITNSIDDYMAQRLAVDSCLRMGTRYLGHIPYTGDKAGEISRDWSPFYLDTESLVRMTSEYITDSVGKIEDYMDREVGHVGIVSAHGGNNHLKDEEGHISDRVGKPVKYIFPFEGVTVKHKKFGDVGMNHSYHGEHSLAKYLGLLDEVKLKEINELARYDPKKVLEEFPTIASLGGLRFLAGERYDPIRPSPKSTEPAKKFLEEREILADSDVGRRIYEQSLDNIIREYTHFIND